MSISFSGIDDVITPSNNQWGQSRLIIVQAWLDSIDFHIDF